MASKILSLFIIASVTISCCMGGFLPAVPAVVPAAYSVPYASSYSANVVNHAVAAPFVAQPAVYPAPAVYPDLTPIAAYSALPAATVFGR